MATQVEELSDNRVRLRVDVPPADLQHAVEHATSDLARSVKVPGFRKGKVPTQVLEARIGRERIFSEAVESHIGGWFLNAAATSRIRPVAQPEYDYDLPETDDDAFSFTATVSVQPKPQPADWTSLGVPYAESFVYTLDYLAGYLRARPDADFVLVLFGDHQPAASVTGVGARWDVPVHVITRRAAVTRALRAAGFVAGLDLTSAARAGTLADLTSVLLEAFDSHASEHTD